MNHKMIRINIPLLSDWRIKDQLGTKDIWLEEEIKLVLTLILKITSDYNW